MRKSLFVTLLLLTACSSSSGPYPSLQPRTAEAIDPRIQPIRPINDRPVGQSLAARLAALVEQAHSGQAAFAPQAATAERLAEGAGAPQSESWITAQEALTAAIAARAPTATALGDIDTLAATALQTQGGIAPRDLQAIQRAAAEVSSIANAQADRIAVIQKRLGI